MIWRIRLLGILVGACSSILALTATAFAGLSALPQSYVELLPDGWHMLVFLAPAQSDPEYVDKGKRAALPDGSNVDLRETFPASGCYEVGSTKPVWTAPWDGRDRWFVTDDGRYLVRLNIYGDGSFRLWANGRPSACGATSWGLKFYDNGKEIKCHNVAELLDFPSLMPYTTWDWHHDWIGYYPDYPEIKNGEFRFNTSTHESYRFDLTSGEIIEQFHLWRPLARTARSVIAAGLLSTVVVLMRRRRRATADGHAPIVEDEGKLQTGAARTWKPYRFGMRVLRGATTLIAVLCLTVPRWPHFLVFSAAILATLWFWYVAVRYRRRSRGLAISRKRRAAGVGARFAAAGMAAVVCYVLSMGPVLGIADRLKAGDDVRMAILLTVYRPLLWLPSEWVDGRWLDRYMDSWG